VSHKRLEAEPAIPTPHDLRVHPVTEELVWLSFEHPDPTAPEGLTEAEQSIALLVYAGRSNREIASARGVSTKTVGNQLDAIYRKLGVQSRVELVLVLQGKRPERSLE
jgi:DNA-binding NarL/FixJ family response regulator